MSKCLGMCCCMCGKQLYEAEHISVDDNGNIIAMCSECHDKAKQFFRGGAKNVKS